MNPLTKIIEEQKMSMQKELSYDFSFSTHETIESAVHNWHTSSIKAILQAQIEMLKKVSRRKVGEHTINGSKYDIEDTIPEIESQINLLQETIDSLK